MDFDKNRRFGVSIVRFAELMTFSGLLCNNTATIILSGLLFIVPMILGT